MDRGVPRLALSGLGPMGGADAAWVLDRDGAVVAIVAEPDAPPEVEALRDAAIGAALSADLGDVVLAGVAFAPRWGDDAVGFT